MCLQSSPWPAATISGDGSLLPAFSGRVIPWTRTLVLQWLPCQASGNTGSALGLVGLVSVYCDWVRKKVWSATSVSVWQHVQMSEQIRPWNTLSCCRDCKQQQLCGPVVRRPLQYLEMGDCFSIWRWAIASVSGDGRLLQYLEMGVRFSI